jgi:hypothetical protein
VDEREVEVAVGLERPPHAGDLAPLRGDRRAHALLRLGQPALGREPGGARLHDEPAS